MDHTLFQHIDNLPTAGAALLPLAPEYWPQAPNVPVTLFSTQLYTATLWFGPEFSWEMYCAHPSITVTLPGWRSLTIGEEG